jgi:hypothetical protein
MGHSMLLQDWITTQGNNNSVIQAESDYLEIPGFQDGAFYIEIAQMTGVAAGAAAMNIYVQTSPTKDDVFFGAMPSGGSAYVVNFASPYAAAPTPLGVQPVVYSRWASVTTTQALARFLRWKIVFGNVAQSITFRMWINFNQAGWM